MSMRAWSSFSSPLRSSRHLSVPHPQNGASTLGAGGSVSLRKKATPLMVTSLVDVFSILVIYLLFGPALSGEAVNPELGVKLPVAVHSDLTDRETHLVIKDQRYFLQNREISAAELLPELKKLSEQFQRDAERQTRGQSGLFASPLDSPMDSPITKTLVIMADQTNNIEKINPVLIAASEAGLSHLRLAVEHQGD